MNFKNLLSIACFALFALSSCSNEEEPNCSDNTFGQEKYVRFDGTIEGQQAAKTKASGTTWGQDAIGVYMKTAGASLSPSPLAENVKYTTTGNGSFVAAATGIEFPETGSVDFIAYYPWQATISGFNYPVNVSDQSDLTKIDLLYSNDAKNLSKASAAVAMNFEHQLSLLVLNITAGSGVSSLSGLTVSISDLVTGADFDLTNAGASDAAIVLGTAKASLNPVVTTVSATSATVNAILIPKNDLHNGKVSFTLNNKVYNWTPDAQLLASGYKYTYSIQLTATGAVVVNPTGTISDWTEGNTGGTDIILTPEEGDVLTVDKPTVALDATATAAIVNLTAQAGEAWTASSDQSWLVVSPASGTGSASITLTPSANTGAERTATVTLAPVTKAALTPVTITVTQAAGSVTPPTPSTADLVFLGSDFEDWTAFTASVAGNPLLYSTQSLGNGRNGSAALYISGAVTANGYAFTAKAGTTPIPASATKITFYLKGTATGRSLSINVYDPNAAGGFYAYNLGGNGTSAAAGIAVTGDVTVESNKSTNAYFGSIDTGGGWIKVTLNLPSGCTLATSDKLFSVKVGGKSTSDAGNYNLYIDDIVFE